MSTAHNARPNGPTSPLRGRYLVKNPYANAFLRIMDFILNILVVRRNTQNVKDLVPRRILVANAAHLGDVLIASSVLPVLKDAFPSAELGLLVGSWAKPVVVGNPNIKWVHYVDHWKINRAKVSLLQKIRIYLNSKKKAITEIRSVNYDLAIDLYTYFPNFIPILWQAKIPHRIGYGSGGFGGLLTNETEWRDLDCHIVDYHRALLAELDIPGRAYSKLAPVLPRLKSESWPALSSRLGIYEKNYIVLHVGTGSLLREWPIESWRELTSKLVEDGHLLVFTGSGVSESEKINIITRSLANCLNLCDKLNWLEFVEIVARSRLLVGVESLAGHLASAVETPCIFIKSGITHALHWRPMSSLCKVITNSVSCAPCYRSNGCESMDCVRGVVPSAVYEACVELPPVTQAR